MEGEHGSKEGTEVYLVALRIVDCGLRIGRTSPNPQRSIPMSSAGALNATRGSRGTTTLLQGSAELTMLRLVKSVTNKGHSA